MTNNIIKDQSVLKVATWLISILQRSIEIKISKKRSINIISDMVAFKPVNERRLGRLSARSIDRFHVQGGKIMH